MADPAGIPAVTTVPVVRTPAGAAAIADLDDRVAAALRHALAPNTWRAYAADWRHWSAWARSYDTPAMPAEPADLARYLVDEATTTRITTLTRRLSAIAKAHRLAGHDDPTGVPAVRGVLHGLRREPGTTQRGAPPLWTSDVERILAATYTVPNQTWGYGGGTAEVRDRALLLLAFTSALRRSELAALDLADLEADPAGLVVHVRRGKTDQTAEGSLVGIPHASRSRLCAVTAIDAWRLRLATLLDVDPTALTGPVLVTIFCQEVRSYLTDPDRRAAVRDTVADTITAARPRVLFAHSLGSVVAYETLWARPDLQVELLVTVGSPLGMPDVVFDRLQPGPTNGRGQRPPGVRRWINIADPGDIVAVPRGLAASFTGIDADLTTPIGVFNFHKVTGYLSCTTTAAALATLLGQ